MADIIQRGLNLQVGAEDLASQTLLGIGDALAELQARAEETFGAVGGVGDEAAARLAEAAGQITPVWMDQLQAVSDYAMTVFNEIATTAMEAADAISQAVMPAQASWEAALGTLTGEAATAGAEVEASLGGAFATAAGAAEAGSAKVVESLGGVAGEARVAAGSLDAIGASLDAAPAKIEGDVGKIDDALGGVSAEAKVASESLKLIGGALATAPAKVGDDIAGIETRLTGLSETAATAADAVQGDYADAFAKIVADGDLMAKKLAEAFAGSDAAAMGALGFPAAVGRGKGKAGKTAGMGPGGVLITPAAETGLVDEAALKTEQSRVTEFADAVKKSFTEARVAFSEFKDTVEGGVSKAGMTAIMASLAPFGMETGANFIEQLANVMLATHLKAAQAAQFEQIMSGVASNQGAGTGANQMITLGQRFITKVMGASAAFNPITMNDTYGTAADLGYGRKGIIPSTLTVGTPNEQLAKYLAFLKVNPNTLTHENLPQMYVTISEAINKFLATEEKFGPKQANWASNVIQGFVRTGFGGQGGISSGGTAGMALALKDYLVSVEQNKGVINPVAGTSIASNLDQSLGTAIGAKEQATAISQGFDVVLVELLPALKDFTAALGHFATFIKDLTHPTSKSVANDLKYFIPDSWTGVATDALGIWAAAKTKGLAKGAVGAGRKVVAPLAEATGLDTAASTALEKVLPEGLAGLAPEIISKVLGPIGVAYSFLQSPGDLVNETSPKNLAWQKIVAPHTGQKGFTEKDTVDAITTIAKVFGLNVQAMLADSFAEAGLSPTTVNPKSGATGAFQFMPKTWAADTKKYLGQSLPFSYAANPYDAAFIAAMDMRSRGIGVAGKGGSSIALADMLKNFENPGGTFSNPKTGLGGDWAHGIPFLNALNAGANPAQSAQAKQQLEQSLKQTDALFKTHNTANVQQVDLMMKDWVLTVRKDYPLLYAEHKKQLDAILQFVEKEKDPFTKAGKSLMLGLMAGLEAEKPALLKEAAAIGGEMEAALKGQLKIKSPSQVGIEIGAAFTQGVAIGISGSTAPGHAAAGVSSGIVGAFGGGAGGGGGGITIGQINIYGPRASSNRELAKDIVDEVQTQMWQRMKVQKNVQSNVY